jgi:hypothetical protein
MLIGNASKANPILFETNAVPYHQRITGTPSPICSLIWTALAESSPARTRISCLAMILERLSV